MEQVVRHLREGVIGAAPACALTIVSSDLSSRGRQDIMHQLVADYSLALQQQRAQAVHMRLLALDGSMDAFLAPSTSTSVLDGWSDPSGWLRYGSCAGSSNKPATN
jgi:hypothetical protein